MEENTTKNAKIIKKKKKEKINWLSVELLTWWCTATILAQKSMEMILLYYSFSLFEALNNNLVA